MTSDPAFLFYDGDAARDVSHMNRLERGCYFDFIQAQRKFGSLTIEQIKKVLGKDFETCFPSLELILEKEGEAYTIPWVKNSILKRKRHCELQKQRVTVRWNAYHGNTAVIPPAYLKENENEKTSSFLSSSSFGFNNNINSLAGSEEGEKTEEVKKRGVDLPEREATFKAEVQAITDYPKEMLDGFFNYWSEADRLGKKMRFEREKTWDLKKRLANWYSRSKDYGGGKTGGRQKLEYERNTEGKYDHLSPTPIGDSA